uniref:Uncharacterized protein n=1 Tax=Oryza sativa subsp. japonica TaxID=39947 RepID=Q6EPB0_ORYSJ|nr:hypothetical protein [Oryza sativa Japonica Group]
MDEVVATMDISEANEGYASCGSVSEEEDIVSCSPKLRKTAGSASEVEEAVKPAVKQE